MEALLSDPFENMALALSGGGFRAAAYGLGTMSYLQQIPWNGQTMMERVSFISSTSGGSITNAFYVSRLYREVPIPEILEELYRHLASDLLIESALARLTDDKVWQVYPHKERNLINAFAITYHEDLFDRLTLAQIWKAIQKSHLEGLCINSTELNNGISFRFQLRTDEEDLRGFGNNYIKFKSEAFEAVQSLRIADIVAASSSFPLGFEPIVFPQDFVLGNRAPESLLDQMDISHNNPLDLDSVKHRAFGLLDGGVVDNQGIYGLGLEDLHRQRKGTNPEDACLDPERRPFSLLIISDVASYFMRPYQVPEVKPAIWKRVPLFALLPGMVLASLLPFVATILFAVQRSPWYDFLLLMPGYILSAITIFASLEGWRFIKRESEQAPIKVLRKFAWGLLKRPLGWWLKMVLSRNDSFTQLAQDVFLKQIRRMHQANTYENQRNFGRILSNFIYDLSMAQEPRREEELVRRDEAWWSKYENVLRPSVEMQQIAENARNVGTTLWFGGERVDALDTVVATAQFTTCYNLIKFINRYEVLKQGEISPEIEALRQRLLADWSKFKQDPWCNLSLLKPAPSSQK